MEDFPLISPNSPLSVTMDNLPSLLVFGPHTELPPEQILQGFRQDLINRPQLSALKQAVEDLPQFWQVLIKFDSNLSRLPAEKYLKDLGQWVKDGGPFPHHGSKLPNHYALAVTVLLQVIQYTRYLDHLGKGSHRKVLDSVKDGGIQGFCVGFLSAVAVATSESEVDIGPSAAIALRLAVCIGAYVDQDGLYSPSALEYSALAIRWREGDTEQKTAAAKIIQSIPHVSGHSCLLSKAVIR